MTEEMEEWEKRLGIPLPPDMDPQRKAILKADCLALERQEDEMLTVPGKSVVEPLATNKEGVARQQAGGDNEASCNGDANDRSLGEIETGCPADQQSPTAETPPTEDETKESGVCGTSFLQEIFTKKTEGPNGMHADRGPWPFPDLPSDQSQLPKPQDQGEREDSQHA